MNPARIAAFERIDRNDPTLAVDELEDFLPALSDVEDQTLTVSTLYKLFGDTPFVASSPSEEPLATMFDPASDAGNLEACFRRLERTAQAAPAADAVDDVVEEYAAVDYLVDDAVGDDTLEELGASGESAIAAPTASQQVALDFQRFTDKFHAFAVECRQR
jgi:hypothetical protein